MFEYNKRELKSRILPIIYWFIALKLITYIYKTICEFITWQLDWNKVLLLEGIRSILEKYSNTTLQATQAMETKTEVKIDKLSKELYKETHQLSGDI